MCRGLEDARRILAVVILTVLATLLPALAALWKVWWISLSLYDATTMPGHMDRKQLR